jgi:hypothetical protein
MLPSLIHKWNVGIIEYLKGRDVAEHLPCGQSQLAVIGLFSEKTDNRRNFNFSMLVNLFLMRIS